MMRFWTVAAALGVVLCAAPAFAQNIVQQSPTTFSGTNFQRNSGVIELKPGGVLTPPTAVALGGVFSSTAPADQFATGINTSGVVTYAQPAFSNLSGTIAASQLIAPTVSTLGGVLSSTAGTSQFATGINTSGVVTYAQPAIAGISGLGTGVATFLGTPTSANLRGALTDETGTGLAYFQGGDLGTPSAGVLTNATGLPVGTGVSGLGTGVAAFLATPSSANLRAALTDETGTGVAYFVGGALGTPSSATLTSATGLPITTGFAGIADDQLILGSGANTAAAATLPTCLDSSGNHLNYNASTNTFLCGTSSSGGGGGLSGMTAGQIPIAATATTVTSSGNLSGDITSNATLATTLATVNGNVGTFQGITVNGKGLVTAATNQSYLTTALAASTYAPIASPTFTGRATTAASATGGAGLNLPHGAAPTGGNLVNGDVWTTTAGMFVRINGATVGPFAASGTGLSGMTAGQIPIAATATTITSSGNLSGDVATSGSLATTLATVNSNVGTFQGITVNGKGLVTAAANQNYLTSATAASTYLPLVGGTLTGTLTVSPASGMTDLWLTSATSGARVLGTRGANPRWMLYLGDGTAEGGSNAGNNFSLDRYNDAGSYLGSPLTINRATGNAAFAGTLAAPAVTVSGISGSTQCLQANSSGVISGTGAACGSAAPTFPVAIGWVPGVDPAQAVIFTASRSMTVTDIRGRVVTAVGGAATVAIRKAPSGTACASGTLQHTGTFNANGTANTNQSLTLAGGAANILAADDSLCLVTTGTWTGAGTGNGGITVSVQ